MKKTVTAVLDVGIIQKKLILFDENFEVVEVTSEKLAKTKDDDGFEGDDIQLLNQWATETWNKLVSSDQYEVKALNFSTYGATFMHIDESGNTLTPLYSYLKPFDEALDTQFYDKYGDKVKFALETCSPPLGMLNSGLQIYWLKHTKPEIYNRIQYSLHLPQYLAYLFTKEATTEYTSIGCHTGIWNFRRRDYHQWVKDEGIDKIIPDFSTSPVVGHWEGQGKQIPVGTGLHDSSSALRTYLHLFDEKFLLLGMTDTWCITLNPFDHSPLRPEDVSQDCLQYLTVQGRRVKASRFFIGNEHGYQFNRMSQHFGKPNDYHKSVKFDENLFNKAQATAKGDARSLVPHSFDASGAHKADSDAGKEWDLSVFDSYEDAYHQLMRDLISFFEPAIAIAARKGLPKYLIVDGEFTDDEIFLNTLSKIYPSVEVLVPNMPEGAATGAALLINQYLNPQMKKPELGFKKY
jgi:glycerol kinase